MNNEEPKHPLPFDERNKQDFELVTNRIHDALAKMATDRRLKRNETNLAKLARCSRGTLRNREWPLKSLQKLKEEAKTFKQPQEEEPRSAKEKTRVERYQEQLKKNRDELMAWKFKHDDLRDSVQTLTEQRDQWKKIAEKFEAELSALKKERHNSKSTKGKVLRLPAANSQTKDILGE